MEEVEREEIGQHYRSQSHKRHRSELFREATAYRDQCEGGSRLCGACPVLVGDDYTCICRIGWFRYYDDRWYRNLFGYYNPDTGQIDEMYPLDVREENYDWQVVALRPDACQRQLPRGDSREKSIILPDIGIERTAKKGILQGITGGWKPEEKRNLKGTELPDVTVDWVEEEEPEQPDFFTGWEKVIKGVDL
jgi:hypothetical protein